MAKQAAKPTLSPQAKTLVDELTTGTPKLGTIKQHGKAIKKDHALAWELWTTGLHHPRLLATLIFDPKQLTATDIEQLADAMLDQPEDEREQLGDWLLANQLRKNRKLTALLEAAQDHQHPLLRRWFWYHQARLRWTGTAQPTEANAALLDAIDAGMADEHPDVQWAMNFCAGWIGVFDPALRKRCVAIGTTHGLYKDEVVAKNCTPSYLPEFIRIEVAKRA